MKIENIKKYFVLVGILLFISWSSQGHESSSYAKSDAQIITHFHNVEWVGCISENHCVFNLNDEIPAFFGKGLVIRMTTLNVPSYSYGKCTAERRFGGVIMSELHNFFKKANVIDLFMCKKIFSGLEILCNVEADRQSVDKWMKEKFSLNNLPTDWCL